jgi:hypothetical protein
MRRKKPLTGAERQKRYADSKRAAGYKSIWVTTEEKAVVLAYREKQSSHARHGDVLQEAAERHHQA